MVVKTKGEKPLLRGDHIDGNDFNDIQCPTNNRLGYRGTFLPPLPQEHPIGLTRRPVHARDKSSARKATFLYSVRESSKEIKCARKGSSKSCLNKRRN